MAGGDVIDVDAFEEDDEITLIKTEQQKPPASPRVRESSYDRDKDRGRDERDRRRSRSGSPDRRDRRRSSRSRERRRSRSPDRDRDRERRDRDRDTHRDRDRRRSRTPDRDARKRSRSPDRRRDRHYDDAGRSAQSSRPESEVAKTDAPIDTIVGDSVIKRQMEKMQEIKPEAQQATRKMIRGRRDMDGMAGQTHWSTKSKEDMTERDWRIFKEDFRMTIKGGPGAPNPMRAWKEAGLPDGIQQAVREMGFKDPSPVQMQCIPIGLLGRDCIGIAQTGSGKTAAFVIPMSVYISARPILQPELGPYALVMAPTRELAQQIEAEAQRIIRHMHQTVISIVGGVPIQEQATAIRNGAEIVIGTPGRLDDVVNQRYLVLNQCNYVVLDEADRMIDLGFEPQVQTVLDHLPSSNTSEADDDEGRKVFRQTFMFSATMPPTVEKLAQKYLRKPLTVQIGEVGTPIEKIEQVIEWMGSENAKQIRVVQICKEQPPPIIIFANTKEKVEDIAGLLGSEGMRVTVLRGGKSQEERMEALAAFKSGDAEVLVATDVASRGIDVRNVTHVINYEMPKSIETYTHRIGRTGRAGAKGRAISFLNSHDAEVMGPLHELCTRCKVNNLPEQFTRNEAVTGKGHGGGKRGDTIIYAKKTQGRS